MKFRQIELHNIFAYDGKVSFVFPVDDDSKTIALIWGRNGMGKTSFLRALKLLFLGIEPKSVRTLGFPARTLGHRQYVVGDGGNWSGLINRQAAKRAAADGTEVTASVAATWVLDDGTEITAERNWTLTPTGYTEHAVVFDGLERLAGDVAKDRISDLLPPEFVDFFFFDGEDIKSIAESDSRKPIDFDRLLRITFLNDLTAEITNIRTERQRSGMGGSLLTSLNAAEAALVKVRGDHQLAEQKLEDLNEVLTEDSGLLRRLQLRRESLSGGASESQRAALEARQRELLVAISEQQEKITESVPLASPMLANLGLVRSALAAVELQISSRSTAERRFIRKLSPLLPQWIAASDTVLSTEDAARLATSILHGMEGQLPPEVELQLFGSLEPLRAERLRDMLLRWSVAGDDALSAQSAELDLMRRLEFELAEVKEALIQIEVGSQANLDLYRTVVNEIAVIEERMAANNQAKGQHQSRLDEAAKQIADLEIKIATLSESSDRAEQDRNETKFINRVTLALNELREALRAAMREKLEARINVRFDQLVQDHSLVSHVAIDDLYTMTFMDGQNRTIGRSSLSAGLKQLAATALLWAMKDVSGHDMPVVIDTPLGRIDRENQENMLINYYPKLAKQVVILPTNSEIDLHRFNLIKDKVSVEYRIFNETGDRARIEPGTLVAQ